MCARFTRMPQILRRLAQIDQHPETAALALAVSGWQSSKGISSGGRGAGAEQVDFGQSG